MEITIKNIREERCKSKREVYHGIMTEKTYNSIEKGQSDIYYNDLLLILDRLDISLEEFCYNNKSSLSNPFSQEIEYIRKFNHIHNKEDVHLMIKNIHKLNNLSIEKKNTLVSMLKCIYYINKNNFDKAREYGQIVWNRLKKYDCLYAYDLYLLTHIFIVFEDEALDLLIERIERNIVKWRDFNNFSITEISFYLNYGYYSEMNNNKKLALKYYYKALNLSKEKDLANYSAVCMMRIGKLTSNEILYDNGKKFLKYFNSDLCNKIEEELSLK